MLAGIFALCSVLLILLVLYADTACIGPDGTSIGLSHLNEAVFKLFGVNILWYHITDWLGFAALITGFAFSMMGLVQLIKRRSFIKVDKEILLLGGLYLLVIGLYILFENTVVNYRPIIMPDGTRPEASFPSSHTMLVCVIMGSAYMLAGRYFKRRAVICSLKAACIAVIAVTVIGRLISGVHWFTDILGGILISASLLSLYSWAIAKLHDR